MPIRARFCLVDVNTKRYLERGPIFRDVGAGGANILSDHISKEYILSIVLRLDVYPSGHSHITVASRCIRSHGILQKVPGETNANNGLWVPMSGPTETAKAYNF